MQHFFIFLNYCRNRVVTRSHCYCTVAADFEFQPIFTSGAIPKSYNAATMSEQMQVQCRYLHCNYNLHVVIVYVPKKLHCKQKSYRPLEVDNFFLESLIRNQKLRSLVKIIFFLKKLNAQNLRIFHHSVLSYNRLKNYRF